MRDGAFKEADRAQLSFLAPVEKRCLVWMARHTPAWINPDHLSALGLAAMLGALFILDDPIFNGLAISLIFGIFVSTLLTLVVIPVLYYAAMYRKLEKA